MSQDTKNVLAKFVNVANPVFWLKNMSVKNKIALSFGILAVCLVFINGFNAFMAAHIKKVTGRVFYTDLAVAQHASMASKNLSNIRLLITEVGALNNVEEVHVRFSRERAVLDESINSLSGSTGEVSVKTMQLANIGAYYKDLMESADKLFLIFGELDTLAERVETSREQLKSLITDAKGREEGNPAIQTAVTLLIGLSDPEPFRKEQWISRLSGMTEDDRILQGISRLVEVHGAYQEKTLQAQDIQSAFDKQFGILQLSLQKVTQDYQGYAEKEMKGLEDMQLKLANISIVLVIGSLIVALLLGRLTFSSIVKPLSIVTEYAGKLAQGTIPKVELSQFAEKDEFGALARVFRDMCGNIEKIILHIKKNAHDMNTAMKHSIEELQQISGGAASQSAYLEETTGMVAELVMTMEDVSRLSTKSAKLSRDAIGAAHKGGAAVKETINEVHQIQAISHDAEKSLGSLSDASKRINNITEIISAIADQTNMLALNAAIEAARAGEQGRGFAVVSDQVAKLADRSSRSAREIEELITAIQEEIGKVMKVIQDSVNKVAESVKLAEVSGSALGQITTTVDESSREVEAITEFTAQVLEMSRKINDAIQNIAASSEEAAASTENSFHQSKVLGGIATNLNDVVNIFKVDATHPTQNNN